MKYQKYLWIIFFVLIFSSAQSQISISKPWPRAVFQRGNDNYAIIPIEGNYSGTITKMEARLVSFIPGQGKETSWQPLDLNLKTHEFKGGIKVQGGWYTLEVRTLKNHKIVSSTNLQRIGAGEVFVIAGQSNAQGFLGQKESTSPNDDRVSVVNYTGSISSTSALSSPMPPSFTKMNNIIGPYGFSWYWGKLGDTLVKRLKVPVLFLNASYGGTASKQWKKSSLGIMPNDQYTNGMPYINLKNALTEWASLLGVRAILWHQGESDASTWAEIYSANDYFLNIKTVIEQSRTDSQKPDLAWIISRASFSENKTVEAMKKVYEGQSLLIKNIPNVFEGPDTDVYKGHNYRSDGTHFCCKAMALIAQAWADSITNEKFMTSSNPYLSIVH